jgi:hypothetical protein
MQWWCEDHLNSSGPLSFSSSTGAVFSSLLCTKLQRSFAISECISSVVSEHRSQHSPQVRHCGVDGSGSGWEQIGFVSANYRVRHLSQHGYDLEKQSRLFVPLRLIHAPKPLVPKYIMPYRTALGSPTAPYRERRYISCPNRWRFSWWRTIRVTRWQFA